MDYIFKEYTIREIYELLVNDKIELNPPYQRNFIWSPDNQRDLIDTILKGYPLPSFFLFDTGNQKFEMVDGQQRTKTIFRFIKGEITASRAFNKKTFDQIEKEKFFGYRLPVVQITKLDHDDSLKDFYVLINKKGVHLNPAEVHKSEFLDTNFLYLADKLLAYDKFNDLNLFTENTLKRMNDRAFVEELLAYLVSGIKEKKKSVEAVYKTDISDSDKEFLEQKFKHIIDKISVLNNIAPISGTRYRQKNDFYTLFSFVNENLNEPEELLKYQYKILLILDKHDSEGRQLIRPSNEDSESLRQYANNCITQSNSKTAREKRLDFFNAILKNQNTENNEILTDVLAYLAVVFGEQKIQLKNVRGFELLDVDPLE